MLAISLGAYEVCFISPLHRRSITLPPPPLPDTGIATLRTISVLLLPASAIGVVEDVPARVWAKLMPVTGLLPRLVRYGISSSYN